MKNTAYILSVGNEVLSGRTINTNASFLASELEKIGIFTAKVITVADDKNDICNALDEFIKSSSTILIATGGLGPTHDDFTKEVIADYFNIELVFNEESHQDMVNYFGEERNDSNYKQMLQPKGSIIIPNVLGSADGFILNVENKVIASLVGPPYENKPMYENTLKPYLLKYGSEKVVYEYTVCGKSESELENLLGELSMSNKNVSLCPYCANGKIRYQLAANKEFENELDIIKSKFEDIVGDNIVSKNNEEVEEVIVRKLKEKNLTISFAESMTGGLLASMITSVAGASDVIKESFVTYSNSVKAKLLNVRLDTIATYDVVSEEVAKEMALGLHTVTPSDICVSVTGYAGPTGNDVGKVCYAIYFDNNVNTYMEYFKGTRNMIKERAARKILFDVLQVIRHGK